MFRIKGVGVKQTEKEIVENLLNKNISSNKYASKETYYNHLFEQYKSFVDSASKVSERRNSTNTFFLTLHTFLVSVLGIGYDNLGNLKSPFLILPPILAVLVLCYVWWRIIKSYRQLNEAKYKVIGEYERHLPSSPYWNAEWESLGRGKDPKLYTPLTDLENWVPIIFATIYILTGAIITL